MKEKTTYIAVDGTEFKTNKECEAYERGYFKNHDIILLSYSNKLLPITLKGIKDACFIICKTNEAAEFLDKTFTGKAFLPWDDYDVQADAWYYVSDYYDRWFSLKDLEKIVNRLQNQIDIIKDNLSD